MRLVVHVGQFTCVVLGHFPGVVQRVQIVAGPVKGVAVVTHPHFKAHAVAHRNKAVEDHGVANQPGRDSSSKNQRGNHPRQQPALAAANQPPGRQRHQEGDNHDNGRLGKSRKTGKQAKAGP